MTERALRCPQCRAPLAPSRFARSVVCPFCGSTVLIDEQGVPAARFRAAFSVWNTPENHGVTSWMAFGDSRWAIGERIAAGEVSDVFRAARARWPSERALVKVLRDRRDAERFDHERRVLAALQESAAAGAPSIAPRLPQPIAHGEITAGAHAGERAIVLRWAPGFLHTFADVAQVHPRGIEPRASIWIWRRILEALAFVHASGYVHGAVLPPHLLVEDGEHGVRLLGFGAADLVGERLRSVCPGLERFYPADLLASRRLSPAADLAMSARAVAALLGGDPATGEIPGAVPTPLAEIVREVSASGPSDAWKLRQSLGRLAREVFGPPVFCPLSMPQEA